MHPYVLAGLFFASGGCALVYEVVWMRLLALTLSVTVYAVTTVLCAFMGGLALGAAIAGRLADRLRRPLVVYGCVELSIAAVGITAPAVMFNLGPAYAWLYRQLGGAGTALTIARFGLAFAVLMVPCTLMGTTLPLLSRVVIRDRARVGWGAGWLYAANTLGAVAGCIVAGFVMIGAYGLRATSAAAAVVNVMVGLAAIFGGRKVVTPAASTRATARHAEPLSGFVKLACLAFALSGFTAMGYEILWTRALVPFVHNSTYAYSAMLATFLFGLGAGSAVAAKVGDRLRHPVSALGLVETGIGACVVVALLVYGRFVDWVPALATAMGGITSWPRVVVLIFAASATTMLPTTLLFGATFPLVARAVVESIDGVGRRIALAYTANTIGSILGAVIVGFVVLPGLGMRGAFACLVLLNLLIGVVLAFSDASRAGRAVTVALGVVSAVALFTLIPPRFFEQSFVARYGPLLFYREQVTDTVMVTQDMGGGRLIRYGDGRGTAGTVSVREDRAYAHMAMLLHPNPQRVLNICFGVGNSLASVTTYPIDRVDCVELSPGVTYAAPYFAATNRNVLSDPRVHLTIQDGRNFLLTTPEKYDVIRLDPPELHTAGIVNLYTREFYELARAHLNPGGIFSLWVNIAYTPEPELRMIVATMAKVFPHVTIWHGPFLYSWVINGSMEPRLPDMALLKQRFADPSVRADLASIGLDDPFAFLNLFVMADDEARAYAAGAPLVVDDHTRLDFSVPRSAQSFFGISSSITDYWLVDKLDPGNNVFRQAVKLCADKQPVLPHVLNLNASGLTAEQARARLDALAARLPGGCGALAGARRNGRDG